MDYPLLKILDLGVLYDAGKADAFTDLLKQATDLLAPFAVSEEEFLNDVFMEYVPRIQYREATIIGLFDGSTIAGAAIVAKNQFDSKGGTLFGKNAEVVAFGISDEYLGRETSDELAEYALKWLGCLTPLCIATPRMMNSLQPVITDYKWKLEEARQENGTLLKVFNRYEK